MLRSLLRRRRVPLLVLAALAFLLAVPAAVATVSPNLTGRLAAVLAKPNTSQAQKDYDQAVYDDLMALDAPTGNVVVAAGDIAGAGQAMNQTGNVVRAIDPTAVLALGDIAYDSGTLNEFLAYYDPPAAWGSFKSITRPVPGNHEYLTTGARGYYNYFGPAAHAPNGYYSYDLAGWHIVALNSEIAAGGGSSQERWLRADLAASKARCTLAYFHRSLFSSGADHHGDPIVKPLWNALYDAGADVVLGGHDHVYERFAPQNPDGSADAQFGIRAFVVGTGGRRLDAMGSIVANSQVRQNRTFGVLKLTLLSDGYDYEYRAVARGSFTDSGSGRCHRAPSPATRFCVVPRITDKTLGAARKSLTRAHCRLGRVTRAYKRTVARGRVVAQRPLAKTRLPVGSRVNVVVSRGPRR